MNATRIAAVMAISFLCLVSAAGAQQFNTSSDYGPYAAQQVPTVGLPSMRTGGYSLQEQTSPRPERPDTQEQSKPSWAAPAVETGRRTDAGAIRNEVDRKGTPAKPADTAPVQAVDVNTIPTGTVLEGLATVYDGQNLVVDGVAVRLDGAEAPALKQQCLTAKALVWPCGIKAATRLKDYVNGRKVRCIVQSQIGEGAAAICSGNAIADFAGSLVRDGLAVSNGHDKGRYVEAQNYARSIRAGMWIGSFEAPWTWRVANGQ